MACRFRRRITMKITTIFVITLLMASSTAAAVICPPANSDGRQYGPFNYNDPDARVNKLSVVEAFHFTPQVAQLIRGNTGTLGGDIDYVLRAFPNHPRALNAMAQLALREKTDKPDGSHFTVECWFNRAIEFAPSDSTVYLLYGNYLFKTSRTQEALDQYLTAEKIDPQNSNVLYNAGLLYFNLKQYDQSLAYAKKAYAAGFPLPGLRMKLKKVGKWTDN